MILACLPARCTALLIHHAGAEAHLGDTPVEGETKLHGMSPWSENAAGLHVVYAIPLTGQGAY